MAKSNTQTTEPGTAVAVKDQFSGFKKELDLRRAMLMPLLPAHVSFEKFTSIVSSAILANPNLLKCTRASLLKASMEAAELGLSLNPSLKEGDILEVWDSRKGGKVAQFRPRYMGMMKLARQSGEVKSIYAHVVHANDDFHYQLGVDKKLHHVPADGDPGAPTHAYCVWQLADGVKDFEVMTRNQVMAIRDRSSAKNREGKLVGPWVTDEEEMWRKTVVRRASKYMPASTDNFMRAVNMDDLREVGEEPPPYGGAATIPEDAFDVTDVGTSEPDVGGETAGETGPDEKPTERKGTKAAGKLDDLERKSVATDDQRPDSRRGHAQQGNKITEAEVVETLMMPIKDGRPDLDTWFAEAEAALSKLRTSDAIREWVKRHDAALKNAAFAVPDKEKALRQKIDDALMNA